MPNVYFCIAIENFNITELTNNLEKIKHNIIKVLIINTVAIICFAVIDKELTSDFFMYTSILLFKTYKMFKIELISPLQ